MIAEQDAMAIPHADQRLVVTPRRLGLPSRGPTFLLRGFSYAFLGQVPFNLEYRASKRIHDLTSQSPARIELIRAMVAKLLHGLREYALDRGGPTHS